MSNAEEYITEEAIRVSNAKVFPIGTLLVAMYGATVGKLGISNILAATNQAVCAIFPTQQLNTKYLFWFLKNYRNDLIGASFGGAQPNISQTLIRNVEIPLPFPNDLDRSLETQYRIVLRIESTTNELLEACQLYERIAIYTNQLIDAVLSEVFPNLEENFLLIGVC